MGPLNPLPCFGLGFPMKVIQTPPVETALRTLGDADRRRIWAWLDHLKNWENDSLVRQKAQRLADGDNVYKGTVSAKDFLGDYLDFRVQVGEIELLAKAHPSLRTPTGDPIYLRIKPEKCVIVECPVTDC